MKAIPEACVGYSLSERGETVQPILGAVVAWVVDAWLAMNAPRPKRARTERHHSQRAVVHGQGVIAYAFSLMRPVPDAGALERRVALFVMSLVSEALVAQLLLR